MVGCVVRETDFPPPPSISSIRGVVKWIHGWVLFLADVLAGREALGLLCAFQCEVRALPRDVSLPDPQAVGVGAMQLLEVEVPSLRMGEACPGRLDQCQTLDRVSESIFRVRLLAKRVVIPGILCWSRGMPE